MRWDLRFPFSGSVLAGVLLACLALAGCSPLGMAVGAGASVINTASEERGLDGAGVDLVIDAKVRDALFNAGYGLFSDVGVTVRERRVLLTGFVRSEPDHQSVVQIAKAIELVAEIIDAVLVAPSPGFFDDARDHLIEQDLSTSLLFDGSVKSGNYAVVVSGRVVHLLGVAQSQAERDRVLAWARNTAFVRGAFCYALLRNDPRRVSPTANVSSVVITRPDGLPTFATRTPARGDPG